MIRLTSNGRGKSSIPAVKSGLMMSIIADAQADIDVRAHAQRPGGPITPKDAQPMKSRYARVLLAGSGFLADAYDLFVINLVLRLLREEYPQYAASSSIRALEGSVAASALVGSIIGQLVAGSLADIIGRKKIFVTTALLITIGSFGSACSTDSQFLTIYGQLACWRFLLGAGVGGEYPLAATVTSESSSAARRGSLMAAVFSMQGVGALLSVLVVITCLTMGASNAFTWRFALAFGATPVLLAFPWRIKMHETETFKRVKRERSEAKKLSTDSLQGAMHDTGYGYGAGAETGYGTEAGYGTGAEANWAGDGVTDRTVLLQDRGGQVDSGGRGGKGGREYGATVNTEINAGGGVRAMGGRGMGGRGGIGNGGMGVDRSNSHTRMGEIRKAIRYYKWHMLGTSLCWFLLDVDFYANGLFNHEITSSILSHSRSTPLTDAVNSGLLSLIALPGYWLSVFFIDTVGRKRLQMLGFSSMSVLFTTCSLSFPYLMAPEGGLERKYLFLLLYALTFLFSNFGPNTTSFVIPGEIFPPEVRATCHGISAASGKLGAAAGAYLFPLLLGPGGSADPTPEGIRLTMLLCGIVAALGALTTWLLTPTYDAGSLAREGTYLPLDHACLRPTVGDMLVLEEYNESVSRSASQASEVGLETLSQGRLLYGHVDSMDMISQTIGQGQDLGIRQGRVERDWTTLPTSDSSVLISSNGSSSSGKDMGVSERNGGNGS